MKLSLSKCRNVAVLLAIGLLFTVNASAQIAPFLTFAGNYDYDAGSRELTFSYNTADWIDYTNGEFDCLFCLGTDPILGASLVFGTLQNSVSNALVFGPSTFSVQGFFTASLDNFVVNESSDLSWGRLYNIQRTDGGTSRFVDELLANGGGSGNIYIHFAPDAGGVEDFSVTSSGSVGGQVAAPEPVSAVLFLAGGAVFTFRLYRRKTIR